MASSPSMEQNSGVGRGEDALSIILSGYILS